MREPNFMMPKRSPACTSAPTSTRQTTRRARIADDLPRDDRLAAVIDPDLAALVDGRGVVAVGGQEPPGVKLTRVTRPETGMRLTCTSIGDRKMLICCQSPGGAASAAAPAGDEHPAVGRRQHGIVARAGRDAAVGIAKEEREERAEHHERERERPAASDAGDDGEQQAPPMNGSPAGSRRIEAHLTCSFGSNVRSVRL